MIENNKEEDGNTVNRSEGQEMNERREDFVGLEQISGEEMIDKSGPVAVSGKFENEFQEKVEEYVTSKLNNAGEGRKSKVGKMANDTNMGIITKERLNRTRLSNYSKETKTGNQSEVSKTTYTTKLSPAKTLKISVFEHNSIKETQNPSSDRQMEMKIKEIAKAIREKVKKQPMKIINDIDNNRIQDRVRMDRSAYRLSPINKPSNSIDFARQESKLLTFEEAIDSPIDPKTMIKNIVNKEIMTKMWNAINLSQKIKKTKLKLDPIKHKYPITSFRKAILEQDKSLSMEEAKKLKEREEKLQQRRFIYNSSRYERYMKDSKSKQIKDVSLAQQTSIVLLKRDEKEICSSIESIENPQHQHSEYKAISIFPTQIERDTIQSPEIPMPTMPEEQEGSQYNYDFE